MDISPDDLEWVALSLQVRSNKLHDKNWKRRNRTAAKVLMMLVERSKSPRPIDHPGADAVLNVIYEINTMSEDKLPKTQAERDDWGRTTALAMQQTVEAYCQARTAYEKARA